MSQSYLLWVASTAIGLGIAVCYNIYGYYSTKKELQRIAVQEGRTRAIEEIQLDKQFEAENLGYRIVNLTHGIGEKLANRRFLAREF